MGQQGTGSKGETTGPFAFGPSQFDINSIMNATGQNQGEIGARYDELGMGGSTPEQQDLSQQNLLGEAAVGQQQTADVGNPAFNPALQTPTTNQSGTVIGSALGSAASGVKSLVGTS